MPQTDSTPRVAPLLLEARSTLLLAAARRDILGDALLLGGLDGLARALEPELASPSVEGLADPSLALACARAVADAVAAAAEQDPELALAALGGGLLDVMRTRLGIDASPERHSPSAGDAPGLASELAPELGRERSAAAHWRKRAVAADGNLLAVAQAVGVAAIDSSAPGAGAALVERARSRFGGDALHESASTLERGLRDALGVDDGADLIAHCAALRERAEAVDAGPDRVAREAATTVARELDLPLTLLPEDASAVGAARWLALSVASVAARDVRASWPALGLPEDESPAELARHAAALREDLAATHAALGRTGKGAGALALASDLRRLLEERALRDVQPEGGAGRSPLRVGEARKLIADAAHALAGTAPAGKFDVDAALREVCESVARLRRRVLSVAAEPPSQHLHGAVDVLERMAEAGWLSPDHVDALCGVLAVATERLGGAAPEDRDVEALARNLARLAGEAVDQGVVRDVGGIAIPPEVCARARQHMLDAVATLSSRGVSVEHQGLALDALAERVLDHARLRARQEDVASRDAVEIGDVLSEARALAATVGADVTAGADLIGILRACREAAADERADEASDDVAVVDQAVTELLGALGVSSRAPATLADVASGSAAVRRIVDPLRDLERALSLAPEGTVGERVRACERALSARQGRALDVAQLHALADALGLREPSDLDARFSACVQAVVRVATSVELAAAALDAGGGEDEALADVADRLRARIADGAVVRHDDDGAALAAATRVARAAWPLVAGSAAAAGTRSLSGELEEVADHVERARRELESMADQLGVEKPDEESLVDLAALVHVHVVSAVDDHEAVVSWSRRAHAALQRFDIILACEAPSLAISPEREEAAQDEPTVAELLSHSSSGLLHALREYSRRPVGSDPSPAASDLDALLPRDWDLTQVLRDVLLPGVVEEDDDPVDDPVDVQLVTSVSFAEDVLRRFDAQLESVTRPTPDERADRLSIAIEEALR